MRSRRPLAFAACMALFVSPSLAADLTLDGTWGNGAGCAFEKSGDFSDDSLVLLKAEGMETFVMSCEWVDVATAKDGTQVATGLCAHEGEDYRSVETYIVGRHPTDPGVIRISAESGENWNEVKKCP